MSENENDNVPNPYLEGLGIVALVFIMVWVLNLLSDGFDYLFENPAMLVGLFIAFSIVAFWNQARRKRKQASRRQS